MCLMGISQKRGQRDEPDAIKLIIELSSHLSGPLLNAQGQNDHQEGNYNEEKKTKHMGEKL